MSLYSQFDNTSSFARPLAPVKPPTTRRKCASPTASMKDRTEDTENIFSEDAGSVCCTIIGAETSSEVLIAGEGSGLGWPSSGSAAGEFNDPACDGARRVVNNPLFSSKTWIASSMMSSRTR